MFFQFDFSLLDAARLQQQMLIAKELNKNHRSLYREHIEKNLADLAPYLFKTEKDTEFNDWYVKNGWGNAWGVFVQSQPDFEILYKHFQKFLLIKTENGEELYFRFYDPRVLRIFLPTCDAQQLKEFFGPIQKFICEDEDAAFAFLFSFDGQKLVTERVAADSIFPTISQSDKTNITSSSGENYEQDDTMQQEVKPKRRFFY